MGGADYLWAVCGAVGGANGLRAGEMNEPNSMTARFEEPAVFYVVFWGFFEEGRGREGVGGRGREGEG